jgi:cation diffusion facilitator family transporter
MRQHVSAAEDHHHHPHEHDHTSEHSHTHGKGFWGWFTTIFHLHGHSHTESALNDSRWKQGDDGIRTVWLALGALGLTTLLQIVIVAFSGSVALLADTIHNLGDTLNSIPLLIAFYLARRAATRRYTYGFGRAEDIAGILIVLSIAFSAAVIFWESFQKLLNPQPMQNIPWVAAAAVIGFLGNEAVALLQIRAGRRMGSDAMIADGLHARIDGLTSLVVLAAVGGSLIGLPILDPIIGLLIGTAILFITRDAARRMWYRLMDAIDPSIIEQIEHALSHVDGIDTVENLRVRWIGHQLQAEMTLVAGGSLSLQAADQLSAKVRSSLQAHVKHLGLIYIEVRPAG